MSTVNTKKEKHSRHQFVIADVNEDSHLNWMGGVSYFQNNPINVLRMAASSCFFGEPAYYAKGKKNKQVLPDDSMAYLRETLQAVDPVEWRSMSTAEIMEKTIDAALDFDPEATLLLAGELRNEWMIRVTPQVIMVRAAHHPNVRGTGLIGAHWSSIIHRADEPATQLAYHNSAYGLDSPIPNSLKKAWRRYLEGQSEYSLAKYRGGGNKVSLVDVVNVVHAKGYAIDKLMKGDLVLEDNTWESIISSRGSTAEAWKEALDSFLLNPAGHMALLRNLRNLHKVGLLNSVVENALVAGVSSGKQLPFRYFSAYRELKVAGADPSTLVALEDSLMLSIKNLPHFKGRVMSLVDNSGSAIGAVTSSMSSMSVADIGNLTGVLTGMAADDGYVGIFGDDLITLKIDQNRRVFPQLQEINKKADRVGRSTENGIWLFFDNAIRNKEHWDHIFVYSDMQAGHGGLYGEVYEENDNWYKDFVFTSGNDGCFEDVQYIDVAKLVKEYRNRVNPNVFVYLVQIAGYTNTLMPESYHRTFILGGWGPGLLRYAYEQYKMFSDSTDN